MYHWIPSTLNCYKTKGSGLCVCFRPTSGTVSAYPPPPPAMVRSRTSSRYDDLFVRVRDNDLKYAHRALEAWAFLGAKAVHSKLSQTMLFLGCLLGGLQNFNLLGFYGVHNTGAKRLSFWTVSEVSPGILQLLEGSLGPSSLLAKQSSSEWM